MMEFCVGDHVALSVQVRHGGIVIPPGIPGRVIEINGDDVKISWMDMDRLQFIQGSVPRKFVCEVQAA
jgi:hypothetical protein